jgi:hypothetical protein
MMTFGTLMAIITEILAPLSENIDATIVSENGSPIQIFTYFCYSQG